MQDAIKLKANRLPKISKSRRIWLRRRLWKLSIMKFRADDHIKDIAELVELTSHELVLW